MIRSADFVRLGLVVLAFGACRSPRTSGPALSARPAPTATDASSPAAGQPDAGLGSVALVPPRPAHVGWIAAGGGSIPELNQISLAQDLALARDVFGAPRGLLLYASGPGSLVQVRDANAPTDTLPLRLGDLFEARGARDAHYVPAPLTPHAEATPERLEMELRAALADGSDPLWLYLPAHGGQGEQPRDNTVALWGDADLSVADLATMLDDTPTRRPVRVIVSSCFSGGFADLVFRDARASAGAAAGAAAGERCGFFASTWDRESSGCDPDPDRRAQEGYSLHLLHALVRTDRDGRRLAPRDIDFDGDGTISLLEAHTRARIAGGSIDVPTSTSERWLRSAAPMSGPGDPVSLPEETATIAGLAERLHLTRLDEASARLARVSAQLDTLHDQSRTLDEHLDTSVHQLQTTLLARWPMLDDPWHPDWSGTVARDHDAIAEVLDRDEAARTVTQIRAEQAALSSQIDPLEVAAAQWMRLVRAQENLVLAGRLHARGGAAWSVYQRLLACERSAPPR